MILSKRVRTSGSYSAVNNGAEQARERLVLNS